MNNILSLLIILLILVIITVLFEKIEHFPYWKCDLAKRDKQNCKLNFPCESCDMGTEEVLDGEIQCPEVKPKDLSCCNC